MKLSFTRLFGVILATTQFADAKSPRLAYVSDNDADGKSLVDLGTTFNSSMLKLVGHAIVNIDEDVTELCKNAKCTGWSSWSDCTSHLRNTFGFQSRTRRCWYTSSSACARDGPVTTETDSVVCEGFCVSGYNFTANKHCMKLHLNTSTHLVAEKQCQSEGGHLINTDTKGRWSDFTNLVTPLTKLPVWIDGTRTTQAGRWSFISGLHLSISGLTFYGSGEPSNGATELCMATALASGKRYWYDRNCEIRYSFVCEIRKK